MKIDTLRVARVLSSLCAAMAAISPAQADTYDGFAQLSNITFTFSDKASYVDLSSVTTSSAAYSGPGSPPYGPTYNYLYFDESPGMATTQHQAQSGGSTFSTTSTSNSLTASMSQVALPGPFAEEYPFGASISFQGNVVMAPNSSATITADFDVYGSSAVSLGASVYTTEIGNGTAHRTGQLADSLYVDQNGGTRAFSLTATSAGYFSATAPVTPMPEPSTWALFLAGLGWTGITAWQRKRRQRADTSIA